MSKKIEFTAVDFSENPEMIQLDGKNLFALRYESKHAKLYIAYDSIKRSLDHCLHGIYYINKNRDNKEEPFVNENITAHFTSLVVKYARCFVSGRVKLEKGNIPKEYKKSHEMLMRLRHEYVAHSGGSGEATVNLIALYPNSQKKKILKIAAPKLFTVNYINQPFLMDVQNIVMHLQDLVEEKLKVHYKKICEEIESVNISNLYAEFQKYDLDGLEYSPQFSPGEYEFRFEAHPNGMVYLKGDRK